MTDIWFLAGDKQKLGPFSWSQLREKAAAGELVLDTMLLQSGTTKWVRAASLAGLWPPLATAVIPSSPLQDAWFVARARQKTGPFSFVQLQAQASSGELSPGDMLLQEGMTKWVPGASLRGLFPQNEPPADLERPKTRKSAPISSNLPQVRSSLQDGATPKGRAGMTWKQLAGAGTLLLVLVIVSMIIMAVVVSKFVEKLNAVVAKNENPPVPLHQAAPEKKDSAPESTPSREEKDTPKAVPKEKATPTTVAPEEKLSPTQTAHPSILVLAPRVLENGGIPFITKPSDITWEWLTFSPDGTTLAGAGEAPKPNTGTTTVGRTRHTNGFLQVWNLVTYRSEKTKLLFDNGCQRPALHFTADGKMLYANARENQGQDYLAQRGQPIRNAGGSVLFWPMDRAEPVQSGVDAGPAGLFAAAYLTGAGRLHLFNLSTGVEEFDVEQKFTVPKKPGGKPFAYTQFKPRGAASPLPVAVGQPGLFSPDGTALLARATDDPGGLIVWDVAGKKVRSKFASPGEGMVTQIAASSDAGCIAFAATKGRTIHVFDGRSGKSISTIGPLDQPVTGLALTANGESLFYASGGKLHVRRVPSGLDTILPADGDIVGAVAITPDGRLVAAGGNDGAIRLWTLPSPAANIAKKPLAAEPPLVAVGPREVRVTTPQGKTETLALVRLTPQRALFATGMGERLHATAADKRYVKIETIDGQQTWTLDSDKNLYIGPKLIPAPPLPLAAAQKITVEQEDLYLLLGVRRLLAAALEMTDQPGKQEAIAEVRRQAQARHDYLKKAGRSAILAELYADLSTAVDELDRAATDRRAVVAELNQNAIQAAWRRREASQKEMLNVVYGLSLMTLGSLKSQEFVKSETVGNRTTYYFRVHDEFPGWGEAGAAHLLNEALASQVRQAQLKAAEQLADEKTGPALVAALKARNQAVDRVVGRCDVVAARDFGIKKPAPAPDKAGDIAATLAWLDAEAHRVRGRTGRDDPFTLANAALVRSLARPETPVALFKQAQAIVLLVPLVPPASIYDPDRAALLGLAADLITRAVAAETGDSPVTAAYSEKAAYAVYLLDRAIAIQPDDPTGKFREAHSIALAQSDRGPEGLAQCRDLVARKPTSAGAHYTLARLECAAGNTDRGLDYLEQAVVKLGFRKLADAPTRPDFPRSHPRFKSLTEVQVKVRGAAHLTNGYVEVRNTGLFALHDVTFRVQYQVRPPGQKPREEVAEFALATLMPKQTYIVWTKSLPDVRGPSFADYTWVNGTIIVTAPGQGKVESPINSR